MEIKLLCNAFNWVHGKTFHDLYVYHWYSVIEKKTQKNEIVYLTFSINFKYHIHVYFFMVKGNTAEDKKEVFLVINSNETI